MHLHHGAAPRFEGSETSCPLKFDKTLSSEFLPHNNIGCGNSETVIYNWITSANLVNAIASSRCTHAANVFTLPEKSPTGASFSEFPPLGLRALNERHIARRIELYAMPPQSHAACGPKMLDATTQTTCWELPPLGLRKLNLRDVETLKILCEELFHARYFASLQFRIARL
jgi:hypothetical protein